MIRRPPRSTRTDTLFPYTTLFRSEIVKEALGLHVQIQCSAALNERGDYGKLTGCNKDEIAARYGRAKLQAWRHYWEAVPPGGEGLRVTAAPVLGHCVRRSEARRVGREGVSTGRSRWSPSP